MGPRNLAVILVVEDNEANQLLARSVLELDGYTVLMASSGDEALGRIAQTPPDLVLMDLQLPGRDGLSVTRALKHDPATAGIPIVALTAHAMPGDRERALAAGCSGYIVKPIDTRTLGAEVREFLRPTGDRLTVSR